jgi:hypothetical protein
MRPREAGLGRAEEVDDEQARHVDEAALDLRPQEEQQDADAGLRPDPLRRVDEPLVGVLRAAVPGAVVGLLEGQEAVPDPVGDGAETVGEERQREHGAHDVGDEAEEEERERAPARGVAELAAHPAPEPAPGAERQGRGHVDAEQRAALGPVEGAPHPRPDDEPTADVQPDDRHAEPDAGADREEEVGEPDRARHERAHQEQQLAPGAAPEGAGEEPERLAPDDARRGAGRGRRLGGLRAGGRRVGAGCHGRAHASILSAAPADLHGARTPAVVGISPCPVISHVGRM